MTLRFLRQRKFGVQLVILLGCSLSADEASAQAVDAFYQPSTGSVTYKYTGEELLAGIRLESEAELLVAGEGTDLDGTIICPLSWCPNDQAPNFIEWGSLIGFRFDEAFAGNVLLAGLTETELRDDLTLKYRTLAAPTVDRFGEFFVVPEPGTLGLVIPAAAMMLLNYRRRGDRCYV